VIASKVPDSRMNAKPITTPPEGRGDPFGLVGARLDSRYEVGDLVAQGGFGVVYRAQHRDLRKLVAIKILKTPADFTPKQHANFLRRFAEEARTVAQLDHPHVVRVLDFGTSIMPSGAKAPWMALEWLEGVTLESDFNARIEGALGGRSPAECMALMYPVIEAVGIAHEEGIVHRDIKPGNLMIVSGRRGATRLKLLDFGIAKVMAPEEKRASDRAHTLTQMQAFSPDYAAPEQVSGMRTGPWTDVHALALLLCEMLTATVPFDGSDVMEMCANVLSPRRPTPGQRGVDVGPWEAVLSRALALKPSDRYNNAGELLTALMSDLPAGVDPNDAQLWMSQTGTHRLTPTPGLAPRPSSQPPHPGAYDPSPSNPTVAEGIAPLHAPPGGQLSSILRPPMAGDLGRAPTLLAPPSVTPPQGPMKPTPERAREVLPVSEIPDAAAQVPFTLAGPLANAPTDPPPAPPPPDLPAYDRSLPTEPAPERRSYVAPLLVLIGLFFGGLVAAATVLLLQSPRGVPGPAAQADAAAVASRVPVTPIVAAPVAPPRAAVAVADAAVPDAAPVAAADAGVVAAPLEPAAIEEGSSGHRSRRRHRSRPHRSHRHRDAPVPAE